MAVTHNVGPWSREVFIGERLIGRVVITSTWSYRTERWHDGKWVPIQETFATVEKATSFLLETPHEVNKESVELILKALAYFADRRRFHDGTDSMSGTTARELAEAISNRKLYWSE